MYKKLYMHSGTDACMLPLVFIFIAYIAGVLISPPDAVHGINHDYHAVFKKPGTEPECQQSRAAYCTGATTAWSDSIYADSCRQAAGPAAVRVIPLRARIETWRSLLCPG